MLYIRL